MLFEALLAKVLLTPGKGPVFTILILIQLLVPLIALSQADLFESLLQVKYQEAL